ncbi:MAG TPA: GNAT family N-acetyltransferase [Candidatus Limnocylindria bacterium]|nr:GNAT family N-acetyltransferase [Candidatus Limnocylindria bacterium]
MPAQDLRLRLAEPDRDAEAIASIYRPAVDSTIASFEEAAPTADEMARRTSATLERFPWLVAELDANVVGYAYAGPHRDRPGYRWSANVSVYVDAAWHGQGIGRALYDGLFDLLRRQGYVNAYAGIALPNPASVALHAAMGMRQVARYERVGWKFGAWHDVAWYWLRLAEPEGAPPEPVPIASLDR